MEKGSARLFQQTAPDALKQNWNIVELKTRTRIRQHIAHLLQLTSDETITRSDLQQALRHCIATFGTDFALQLVRALQRATSEERQAIVWLLTVLDASETIQPLQRMATDASLPRAVRLSAALALAGLGVTAEHIQQHQRVHLYLMS
jgi:hypothetical protein